MSENVFGTEWDVEQEQPGFRWKRLRLARRLGGELLGASVYEMSPGERSFPYHFHHANEELLVVLEGTVTVRTPDGEQELETGDATLFRRGAGGAHQVVNRSKAPARFILVSSMIEPDITGFPDTGKVGLFAGAAPGATSPGEVKQFLRGDATADYFEGEDAT